ncbi:interleukin-1 beta isoform X2 [Nelusetta ayraudi]|uniref:interleukin-1 beta isoform X2 n=1 Tax=Nelusetta ayraudi TaxID=303726 RepID=UPI003F71D313
MQSKFCPDTFLEPSTREHISRSLPLRFPPMSAVCDFELSQALDGPPEVDERRPESSSVTMTPPSPQPSRQQQNGNVQGAEEETFHLDRGLDLVVSRSRTGLKRVANLVLAANRMEKLSELCSDAQLCDAIMDDVVQETVVNGRGHATATTAAPAKRVYVRMRSGECCHLLDHAQKAVVKASARMALQAITLTGGHGERRVIFKMAKYTCGPDADGQTVALSISNSSLHISCSMIGDTPALSLEPKVRMISCGRKWMDGFLPPSA